MATDTEQPTSLQTGTTAQPFASNTQDFSESDDEILDNFADGPPPTDSREIDEPQHDGVPMGLGGEKGKQSEPASSTLEADMLSPRERGPDGRFVKTQPGEPPEDTAGEPEPVQDAGEEGTVTTPEPTGEPETPEFPPLLLQMAGYADADAAKEAGFSDPKALLAAIEWRDKMRTPEAPAPSEQGLYRRQSATPAQPQPVTVPVVDPKEVGEVPIGTKQFELPADKMDLLDEDLQDVIRQMNDHYQGLNASQRQELESLRAELQRRDESVMSQQEIEEELQFDKAIQELGEDWHDVFGEGTAQDLDRRAQTDPLASAQLAQRVKLFETMDAIRRVDAEQGYKPSPIPQAVPWALQRRYPEKFQKAILGTSTKRRGVTASRPTQRNTPPTAKDKLLRDLHKKYPDAGFTMQDEDDFGDEI